MNRLGFGFGRREESVCLCGYVHHGCSELVRDLAFLSTFESFLHREILDNYFTSSDQSSYVVSHSLTFNQLRAQTTNVVQSQFQNDGSASPVAIDLDRLVRWSFPPPAPHGMRRTALSVVAPLASPSDELQFEEVSSTRDTTGPDPAKNWRNG